MQQSIWDALLHTAGLRCTTENYKVLVITMMYTMCYMFSLLTTWKIVFPDVAARGRGGGGGFDVSIGLDLDSLNTATFSFFIIFVIFTAWQALVALSLTRKHNEHSTTAVFAILISATLMLITYYAMGAAYVSLDLSQSGPIPQNLGNGFYAMFLFTNYASDVLVVGAIIMFLDYRMTYLAQHHGRIAANRTTKRIIDISLLSLMMLAIVSRTIISGVARATSHSFQQFQANQTASWILYHVHIACYVLSAVHISVTSFVLSSRISLVNVIDPVSDTQDA